MRLRVILPIILALIIAFAGSVFIYKFIKRQTTPKEIVKTGSEVVPIAVAMIDLPWGTQLKKDKIQLTPFLKKTLPSGYFTDLASLEGRVLVTPLKQKEPVLESRLAPTSITTGGISAVIKPGKRAISVKGDKVIGLSGLIKPGNRVDILVTLTDPRNKREVTKIVLEDILVLATGPEIEKNDKGETETSPVDVFTLEVTPEEGEKLALAATQGRLQFALRNAIDMKIVLTKGATIPDALRSYSRIITRNKKINVVGGSVQVIRGTKVSEVIF